MKNIARLAVFGLFALIAGILINGLINQKSELPQQADLLQRGTALIGAERPLIEFNLIDHHGQPLNREAMQGQWSLIFFGYTQCPDICPVTLQVINETLQQLKPEVDAGEVRGVFVSVDPQRDNPEKLKTYVGYFHPAILGATGDDANLRALTQSLGIVYRRVENATNPDNYLVDHSAAILAVSPKGEMVAVLSPPHEAAMMAADFRTLKNYYQ